VQSEQGRGIKETIAACPPALPGAAAAALEVHEGCCCGVLCCTVGTARLQHCPLRTASLSPFYPTHLDIYTPAQTATTPSSPAGTPFQPLHIHTCPVPPLQLPLRLLTHTLCTATATHTSHLEVALQRLGQRVVEHKADVCLVDACGRGWRV
jgi:hypothetical protein